MVYIPLIGTAVAITMVGALIPLHLFLSSIDLPSSGDYVLHYLVLASQITAFMFGFMFFEVALTAVAFEKLEGRTTSVSFGLNAAWERRGAIFAWSAFAGGLLTVLRMITDQLKITGLILRFLGEAAFSIASYFVPTVILTTTHGPITTLKQSAMIMKSRFGAVAKTNIRFGIYSTIGLVVPVIVLMVGIMMTSSGAAIVGVPLIAISVVALFAYSAATRTISAYIRALLFLYATKGEVHGVDPAVLHSAFITK